MRSFLLCILVTLLAGDLFGQRPQRLDLEHADLLEVLLGDFQDTTIAVGSVAFRTESGTIACDSAVWIKGKKVILRGSVVLEDQQYRLLADTVDYSLTTGEALARGPYVELWSRSDSLFAFGTHAFYDRNKKYFRMEHRPTVFLNYPDSAQMVEVIGDLVEYSADSSLAVSEGNVVITSKDVRASANRAEMNQKDNLLELYEQPQLERGKSTVKGRFISVRSENSVLERIEVTDSARAEFKEPVDTLADSTVLYDQSILTGREIIFDFTYGQLSTITSTGQAYSWYYPSDRGGVEVNQNSVSGDTIRFDIREEELRTVTVQGGAIGSYVNAKTQAVDTTQIVTRDTIDYSSRYIQYSMADSVITLLGKSHVESGTVELDAYEVLFDTRKRLIKAYSAEIVDSSQGTDSTLTDRLQPNPIPVILKDKKEELYGDYLEYSIDTEKGRIVQSKSKYETGFYYGERVYRSREDIFYVQDGRYTTCDAEEPHFHFYSKNMKLINNDKMIARPVVFNLGRLPLLALPYYVFPLKKGRHSGILPFRFGNIEQGKRYIENVGYYWAPSEKWDVQSSISYHELNNALTMSGQYRYKTIYVFDGYVNGNYTRQIDYNTTVASERKSTRWDIRAAHNHDFSPSFKVSGSGQYVSDKSYYKDYSINLQNRLNNNIVGKFNLTKRFNKTVALSGGYSHTDYLSTGRRIDQLENFGLSLPVVRPFGSGSVDQEGNLKTRWYNNLSVTPSLRFNFYSERNRLDSVFADTTIIVDTTSDTTIVTDTISSRTRKKYAYTDYSFGANMPLTFFRYIKLNPSFSYRENWQYLFETDQTIRQGLEPDLYRTYSYSTGASASTDIYGTIYPNLFGLLGLRQVITPSFGYSYVPKLNRNPEIRAFTGKGTGSASRAQLLTVGITQLYQAKVKKGDGELNLDLFSVGSNFSYDMERDSFNFSDLNTTIQSNVLPKINLTGDMRHSFYVPGTSDLRFWNPYLQSFNLTATFSLRGDRFLFDDVTEPRLQQGVDSAAQLETRTLDAQQSNKAKGWNASFSYRYSESGRGRAFSKSSFLQLNLTFNLTPTTSVSYSQYYDIGRGYTVRNDVFFRKTLHCWTGEFRWVPIGSGRGYEFRIFVTAIPAIKVDNSSTTGSGTFIQRGF